jgi:single-stranded-DNA-specific exonuclease
MTKQIKNLAEVSQRIKQAVKKKEKIILYGDSDVDGATSVIILKEAIERLGGEIDYCYFFDRATDGYGLNKPALKFLAPRSPALLILVDLGIGNYQEITLANKQGFEVIVIDHHKIPEKLPPASLIIDPKQEDDEYDFKEMTAGGLCYKVAQLLLREDPEYDFFDRSFVELASLSVIADMMPQEKDNADIVVRGLNSLPTTNRLALQILEEKFAEESPSILYLSTKIISLLGASRISSSSHKADVFLALSTSQEGRIRRIIKRLEVNLVKKHRARDEIIATIQEKLEGEKNPSLVFGGESSWSPIALGSAASRLVKLYGCPIFVYHQGEEESTGSVRCPKNVDSVELMRKCSKLLITFGGHAPASGFRVKNSKLNQFKNCLLKNHDQAID